MIYILPTVQIAESFGNNLLPSSVKESVKMHDIGKIVQNSARLYPTNQYNTVYNQQSPGCRASLVVRYNGLFML